VVRRRTFVNGRLAPVHRPTFLHLREDGVGAGDRGDVRRRDVAPPALRVGGGGVRRPLGPQAHDDLRRCVAGRDPRAVADGRRRWSAGPDLRGGIRGGEPLHALYSGQERTRPEPRRRAAANGGKLAELHGGGRSEPDRPRARRRVVRRGGIERPDRTGYRLLPALRRRDLADRRSWLHHATRRGTSGFGRSGRLGLGKRLA
jgi:hypothetical protein